MLNHIKNKYHFFRSLTISLKFMILNSFLFSLGSFMVTPFLGIFLAKNIPMNISAIGILLAVATFIQFGGGIIGGMIAHKCGLKPTMVFSLIFRTFGFILLATATIEHAVIIPAIFLVTAGSAVYMPSNRAYIVSSVAPDMKPLFMSITNTAFNAGMALGPLVAALLINNDPVWLFLTIALMFGLMAIIHQVKLKPIASTDSQADSSTPEKISTVKIFYKVWYPVLFNTLAFYLYFYFQNFMGLYTSIVSNVHFFGWIMFLNFTLMSILQLKLVNFIVAMGYRKLFFSAFLLMAFGMLIMALGNTLEILLGSVIMTIGEAFLFLKGDLEVVNLLPEHPSIAFGIQRLSAGIGGLCSGIFGGRIFEYYHMHATLNMFWLMVSVQCIFSSILVLNFGRVFEFFQTAIRAVVSR